MAIIEEPVDNNKTTQNANMGIPGHRSLVVLGAVAMRSDIGLMICIELINS